MSEENVAQIRGMVDSFNSGQVEAVLAEMDPGITWTEPGGGNAPQGTFTGPESVAQEVFAKVPENFEEFSVNIDDYNEDGDKVVCKGSFKGKAKNGVELDAPFTQTWGFNDGKVASMGIQIEGNWAEAWS